MNLESTSEIPTVEEALSRVQLRNHAAILSGALWGASGLGTILVAILWNHAPATRIAMWSALLAAALAGRFAAGVMHHRIGDRPSPAAVRRALACFRASFVVHGVAWGAAAWLLFPEADVSRQIFLAFVVATVAVGSFTIATFDITAMVLFAAPALLLLVARLLLDGGPIHVAMSALAIAFLAYYRTGAMHASREAEENVALRATETAQGEALRWNEALLKRTGEMVGVGGWELDVEAGELRATAEMNRICDIAPEAALTLEDLTRRYGPEARPLIQAAVRAAIAEAAPFDLELPFLAGDGQTRWVRTMGSPELEDGRVVRLVGALQDVTERRLKEASLLTEVAQRREAEQALIAQKQFLESLSAATLDLLRERDVDNLLQAIVERATGLLRAPIGEIAIEELGGFTIRAVTSNHHLSKGTRMDRAEARMSSQAFDTRSPVVVQDYELPEALAGEVQLVPKAIAAFPILLGTTCLGVLSVARPADGGTFTPDEVRRGEILAQHAALVFHNAGIYAEAVRKTEERTRAFNEGQKRFRRIFESSPIATVLTSIPEGRLLAVNEAGLALVGQARESVMGKTTEELGFWPNLEDRARYVDLLQTRGRVEGFETTMRRPTGELVSVILSAAVVRSEEGASHVLATVLDVTELKEAQRAALQFHMALDQCMDAIYLIDPVTMRFIDLNQTAHARLGYSREEHLALTLDDIADSAPDTGQWRDRIASLRSAGQLTVDERHRRKDGSAFPVEINVRYIVDPARDYLVAVVRDTTERKNAEALSREAEERFRAVFDLSPVMIALLTIPEGQVVEVNEAAIEGFGVARKEAVGRTTLELGLWPSPAHRDEALNALTLSGRTDREVQMRRGDGSAFPALLHSRVIRIGGKVFSLNAIQDITQRKEAEDGLARLNAELEERIDRRTAELELARKNAEQASLTKSQFLANMSHEIRTPLNGVLGMVELIRQTSLAPSQAQMADVAYESAASLLGIVEDILDLSKIEAGMVEVENVPLSLVDTMERACDLLRPGAIQKGVDLRLSLGPDFPNRVLGDALRLRQILHNIVGNAIKFSSGRGVTGNVTVRARQVSRLGETVDVAIEIEDDGIGIGDAAMSRLFVAFAQADASITRRFGGTGLGLNISQNLARMMGGEIQARSEISKGSTFVLLLPFRLDPGGVETERREPGLARPQDAVEVEPQAAGNVSGKRPTDSGEESYSPPPKPEVPGPEGSSGSRPAKILVAEDNPVNQRLILKQLEKLGFPSDLASDGREALDRWSSGDYALLITDLQMPNMDGYELSHEIRTIEKLQGRPPIPIIALTANALKEEEGRCLQAGMNGFVTKPARLADIKAAVERWLPA